MYQTKCSFLSILIILSDICKLAYSWMKFKPICVLKSFSYKTWSINNTSCSFNKVIVSSLDISCIRNCLLLPILTPVWQVFFCKILRLLTSPFSSNHSFLINSSVSNVTIKPALIVDTVRSMLGWSYDVTNVNKATEKVKFNSSTVTLCFLLIQWSWKLCWHSKD